MYTNTLYLAFDPTYYSRVVLRVVANTKSTY